MVLVNMLMDIDPLLMRGSMMMTVDDAYGKCYLAHLEYTVITSF